MPTRASGLPDLLERALARPPRFQPQPRRHGLRIEEVWSDLEGTPWRRSSQTLGVLARRRG